MTLLDLTTSLSTVIVISDGIFLVGMKITISVLELDISNLSSFICLIVRAICNVSLLLALSTDLPIATTLYRRHMPSIGIHFLY